MHIGFIEDTHLHGGTQIWVTEAAQAFLSRGHEVTVLTAKDSWVAERSREANARVVEYDWDRVVNEDGENQRIWTEALKDCDVAVCTVHPPREGFHCAVFAARCIREGRLKTHLIPKTGTIVPDYLREFYLPDETIRSSVIAIAAFTRNYLIESYKIPAEKIALIYQGTDVNRFTSTAENRAEALQRYRLPGGAGPILGCIGSFEPRKGQEVLFEALKDLVKGALPNAHLLLVGDGPDEAMLKEKAKAMNLGGNVSFYPFTDEPELVFERVDITVLPSLYKEGLPNVLLESMSMGKPVVSSDIGGVREVVEDGETGYAVEPGKMGELAEAIENLWGDQEKYAGMQKKARELIRQNFDKDKQFDKFAFHFQELISGN